MPPLTLLAPQVQTFKLEKADPTGETFVTFRQATMKEEERRSQLLSVQEYSWNDKETGVITRKTKWNMIELGRLEVMLTLADCNIVVPVPGADGAPQQNDDGTIKTAPLFKFGKDRLIMKEGEFTEAWGKVYPPEIAAEILECCYKVNKGWAPNPEA